MKAVRMLAGIALWCLACSAWAQQTMPPGVAPGPVADTARGADAAVSQTAERRTERGPVEALVRVEPATVRIGDPVNLTIEVRAEPGVELLMPVFGASLERFAILEFVPREVVEASGRTVATQTYRLQAPASGEHSIPPIVVEFVDRRPGQRAAPADEDAFELLTERLPFRVESVVPTGAGDALKPPLGRLDPQAAQVSSPWIWGTGLTFLAVVIAAVLALAWRRRGRALQRSAYEVALARLDVLAVAARPEDRDAMDDFFVELSDIVRRYLEARFALHAPELTTEEFLDVAAGSPDLTRSQRSFLQSFLSSADQVKFARHVPDPADVETVLSAVRAFLQQTGTSTEETPAAQAPPAQRALEEPGHA